MLLPRFARKHLALRRIARARLFNLASLPADLRADEEVVLKSLPRFPWNFEHAAPELQSNASFLRKAIAACPEVMKHVPAQIAEDKEYVMLAVQLAPGVLRFAHAKFLDDREVVLLAIERESRNYSSYPCNSPSYSLASERLKHDPEIIEAASRYSAHAEQVARSAALR